MRVRTGVAIAACIAALTPGVVQAQPRPNAIAKTSETPWSRGVSEAAQQTALRLFREGNKLLEDAKYTEAFAKYEPALASWDHPSIRYNMALCLINMRQPLQAWNHLEQALRFGEGPLTKQLYAEAMRDRAVLESTLADLTVTSTQDGISVMVDGAELLHGPGTHRLKLLAGKHQLVASRAGFTTDSRALDLPPGRPVTEPVELAPVQVKVQRVNYERRWPWWVPWGVEGTALVVGLVGTGVYVAARSEMRSYDNSFKEQCPQGCPNESISASLAHRASVARRNSGIGIALWSTAGGLAVAGAVMAVLNRPIKQLETAPVAPTLSVSGDRVSVGFTFALP